MKLLIGSNGPRMLAITAPHMDMWNSWYTDFGNRADGLGPLLTQVDQACLAAGRDPKEVERTVAVLIQLERGGGRAGGNSARPAAQPILGHEAGERLAEFERAGIHHLQVVLDPIDASGVEELAALLGR
jgi:alkanesulfonate monooxygenase SsuD/methylene tetrahydromethanopterin reductase-like flavin-dependent oxidoreductase (luciferase family)